MAKNSNSCVFCSGQARVVPQGEIRGGAKFEVAQLEIKVCQPHAKRQIPGGGVLVNADLDPYVVPGVESDWDPDVIKLVKALLGPGFHPAAYDVAEEYVGRLVAKRSEVHKADGEQRVLQAVMSTLGPGRLDQITQFMRETKVESGPMQPESGQQG